MEEAIKTLLESDHFEYQKRLLHFRALRSEMGITEPPPGNLQPDRLLSSAQALQMSGIELLEQGEMDDGKLLLKKASELYEHLASIEQYSQEIRLEMRLLAAITASLSDHQANAYVLSKHLLQESENLASDLKDSYSTFSILAILILRRQINLAKSHIAEEESRLPLREQTLVDRMQVTDLEDLSGDPIIDGWRFLCLKYYLSACTSFINYLETGRNESFEEATSTFSR